MNEEEEEEEASNRRTTIVHHQQTQPVCGAAIIATVDDNETTNCSETMSTNEEDYDACEMLAGVGVSQQQQHELEGSQVRRSGDEQSRSNSGISSVKNRIGTPRRLAFAQQQQLTNSSQQPAGACDDIQQSDSCYYMAVATATDQAQFGCGGGTTTQDEAETSTLSLNSGIQAPPSYSTAVCGIACATLDATHLHHQQQNSISPLPNSTHLVIGGDGLNGQPPLAGGEAAATAASMEHGRNFVSPATNNANNHYSVGRYLATRDTNTTTTNAANPLAERPLFSKTIAGSHTIDSRLGSHSNHVFDQQPQSFSLFSPNNNSQQQQQHLATTRAQNDTTRTSTSYLSSSASLPRIQFVAGSGGSAHLNVVGPNTNDLRCQRQINLKLDNNQSSKLNWQTQSQLQCWEQQQQIVAPMFGAPINHVISARGSMQWQPQTNQCYATVVAPAQTTATSSNTTTTTTTTNATATTTATTTQSVPPPAQVGSQSSQAQAHESTSREEMEADSRQQHYCPPFTSQSLAAQMCKPFPRYSISTNTTLAPLDLSSLLDTTAAAHFVNNNQYVSGGLHHNQRQICATTTACMAPLRKSDENLERSSRSKQQQAHRKRRRHRSTSGRSMSPQRSELRRQAAVAAVGEGEAQATTNYHYHTMGRSSSLNQRHHSLAANVSATPLTTPDADTKLTRTRSAHKQAISAHCWLIDSSDDQIYASTLQFKQQQRQSQLQKGQAQQQQNGKVNNQTKHHLTVAMMKQSQEQQQRSKQENEISSTSALALAATATLARQTHNHPPACKYLTPESQVYGQDLTTNLKTNSLKMERILNRSQTTTVVRDAATTLKVSSGANNKTMTLAERGNQTAERLKRPARVSIEQQQQLSSFSGNSACPRTRTLPHHRVCRRPSSVSSSSESGFTISRHTSHINDNNNNNNHHASSANTVVRLSALLSFVSGLVKRAPKCRKVAGASNSVADSRQDSCPAPANSISGSVSAPSSGCVAPYTAASLAISSSSSTSAYATGSSHLSTTGSNLSSSLRIVQQLNNNHKNERPIILSSRIVKGGPPIVPPSSASTAGSASMFYSSSGVSGVVQLPPSSHGYEYCDNDDHNLQTETHFGQDTLKVDNNNNKEDSCFVPVLIDTNSESESNSSGGSGQLRRYQEEEDNDEEEEAAAAEANKLKQDNRLVHMIMSDNELISAGSDLNTDAGGFGSINNHATTSVFPAAVTNAAPSAARRRWWWISIKNWLRRPCKASDSECGASDHLGKSDQIEAARYRSLRSSSGRRRRRQRRSRSDNNDSNINSSVNGSSSSTIQNVISLAKADRVFRVRLVASIIVSCILLGLICLLASLIYARSSSLVYQRNKFGLSVDDSDYDLSWLWPQTSTTQAGGGDRSGLSPGAPYRILDPLQAKFSLNPTEQMLDNSLRSHFIMIERSERLNQFQQTMTHLTNVQLANDNFIDITQLAKHLAPPINEDHNNNSPNRTNDDDSSLPINNTVLANKTSQQTLFANSKIQLNEADHDLVTLTLLSNLHWPLVKWRHQNQQSVANFLSFAALSPSVSFGGTQTLRNLLSLLMLAESTTTTTGSLPNTLSLNNLNQFARLNSLLRSTSYHIISCSYLLQNTNSNNYRLRAPNLKGKFCTKLITRYKRMMLTLSHLNHNHLSKLHPSSMEPQSPTIGDNTNQQRSSSSSRTLLGFFLDRLSLLDVETLAQAILADDETELECLLESNNLNGVVESILKQDSISILVDTDNGGENVNKWQPNSSLYDLAKLVIGEGPMKLNLNLDRNREFQVKFQQIELDNNDAWRELLAQDLLYPWTSFKLPQFVVPNTYDLFLHPNLTTKLVLGMVKIEFTLERPTRYIVMNCDKLNLVDLTLWLKQSSPSNQDNISGERANHTLPPSTALKQIAIRRVLTNTKLEQIYIELHDQIEPSVGPFIQTSGETGMKQHPSAGVGGLNFGEIPLHDIGHKKNYFVINISFNKTSLITSPLNSQVATKEPGIEFVHYGDYFAQPEAEVKTILYTQFEPSSARRLFPSFDEPQFKAKFQLNLVHEQQHQVLFNSPKRERVPYTSDGAIQMSVFEPTPIPLSTYLVCFVVCDSQNIKSITSRVGQFQPIKSSPNSNNIRQDNKDYKHIQVQILSQFEQLSQAEFASQLVPQLLAFYQSHLQFAYPMEKLDLIAIPKSLPTIQQQQQPESIGVVQTIDTMENMGLIWFKAPLLLVDTNLISQNLIEQISMIISHQLAHQYFGNIVTIRHWQDLWLYESLCQYLESIALSNVQADWKLDEQFVVTTIQETLIIEQFDGIDSTPLDLLLATSAADQQLESQQQQQLIANSSDSSVLNPTIELAPNINKNSNNNRNSNSFEAISYLDLIQEDLEAAADKMQSQQESANRVASMAKYGHLKPTELKRSSALLHMLLFNLLPSTEAQVRLFRRCLNVYKYQTMSRQQFWRQFGEQLTQEGSMDRLSLDLNFASSKQFTILAPPGETSLDLESVSADIDMPQPKLLLARNNNNNLTTDSQPQDNHQSATINERVVFVRPPANGINYQGDDDLTSDVHKIHLNSGRLVDNLNLVAGAWLDRHGYPLITASAYRDRLHLRQERFSFAWWNEPSDVEEGAVHAKWTADSESRRKKRWSQDDNTNTLALDDVWPIPLMFVSRYNPKQVRFFWMNKRELELPFNEHLSSLSSPSVQEYLPMEQQQQQSRKGYSNSWFKLNVNQSSLVRVNYDERNWEALTELLVKSHYSNHLLSSLDRANLIDDSITLMRCGKLSVGVAMNLTLYLEVGEREYMPWTSALRHLDQMQTLLNQNPLWHRYVLKLLQPISSVIGWKDDGPHLMRKLRRSLFSVALQYGDDKTVNKAKQEFKSWFKNGRFIVPNLQELVYVAGVRYGDQQEWFHCWQKYQQLVSIDLNGVSRGSNHSQEKDYIQQSGGRDSQSQSLLAGVPSPIVVGSMINELNEPNAENEKRQLLTALASTQNTWLLEQFLNYSLDYTKIQPHHLKHVMQTLGKNPVARLYLWRFVRLNWLTLIGRYMMGSDEYEFGLFATDRRGQRGGANSAEYHYVLETMIVESTKHFATKLDYEEVKTFFDGKRKQHHQQRPNLDLVTWSPSVERAIQQSLQVIRSNIYWRDYIEPKLTKWLSHYDSIIIS